MVIDMDGKEKIIARILEDAESKSSAIVENARQAGEKLLNEATQEVAEARAVAENKCSIEHGEILKRKLSVAQLDIKKYNLAKKQQIVTETFDRAFKKVMEMDDKKYLLFITKLLKMYAEKGEQLVLCQKGKKVVTSKIASEFGVTLSEKTAQFEGGFVLEGNGYDKDVTLKTLLQQLRFEHESSVASLLFGD